MNNDATPLDAIRCDEPPDPVSGGNVHIEQDLMQDEAGALARALGLVTLLERSGYVVTTRCRATVWEALICGHGESWWEAGETEVNAVEAAVRKMVPCELGRVLLRAAVAENGRHEPSAPSCT